MLRLRILTFLNQNVKIENLNSKKYPSLRREEKGDRRPVGNKSCLPSRMRPAGRWAGREREISKLNTLRRGRRKKRCIEIVFQRCSLSG